MSTMMLLQCVSNVHRQIFQFSHCHVFPINEAQWDFSYERFNNGYKHSETNFIHFSESSKDPTYKISEWNMSMRQVFRKLKHSPARQLTS